MLIVCRIPGNNFPRLICMDDKIEFGHLTNGNNFECVPVEHTRESTKRTIMMDSMGNQWNHHWSYDEWPIVKLELKIKSFIVFRAKAHPRDNPEMELCGAYNADSPTVMLHHVDVICIVFSLLKWTNGLRIGYVFMVSIIIIRFEVDPWSIGLLRLWPDRIPSITCSQHSFNRKATQNFRRNFEWKQTEFPLSLLPTIY